MNKTGRYIFGAKATAAGLYKALSADGSGVKINAFLVSKLEDNVSEIFGCPVKALDKLAAELSDIEKKNTIIYAAVPELVHSEVRLILQEHGFSDIVMLDSHKESDIMEKYFSQEGRFKSVHNLPYEKKESVPKLTIYSASYYKDKHLECPPQLPEYVKTLYLGCYDAIKNKAGIEGKAMFYDNTGDNISQKNKNRCEMTAYYWIWKNRLDTDDDYVGVCHYRRLLDLSEGDLKRIAQNDVDVVLPYPMIHYPDAGIHHTWYVQKADWELMITVVNDLYPEYGKRIEDVFCSYEFYNFNMMVAKKKVFKKYCEWLFPILDRIEELSEPKGTDRADRYTAYLSESLLTLYFMVNMDKLKIYHTGRLLYV